jgi:hypothetical protein
MHTLAYIGNTKLIKMKHLMTLLALVIAVTAGAQTYYFPHNHDSNHDGFIGVDDLMSLLSEYGSVSGLMSDVEIPEYDFTDFESSIFSFWSQEVHLDSIYLHFSFTTEHEWYPVGSIESTTDTIIYNREVTLIPWSGSTNVGFVQYRGVIDAGSVKLFLSHGGSNSGEYSISLEDHTSTIAYLTSIGVVSSRFVASESWHITDGVIDWGMDDTGWLWLPMTYLGANNIELDSFEFIPHFSANE